MVGPNTSWQPGTTATMELSSLNVPASPDPAAAVGRPPGVNMALLRQLLRCEAEGQGRFPDLRTLRYPSFS